MADIESLLTRWQSAGTLDAETAARIRAFEAGEAQDIQVAAHRQPFIANVKWQGLTALILGAILLACGTLLFVSAHWDELGPMARFALVVSVVTVIHLAGAITRDRFYALSTALHAVGTVSTGAAIALVGQIFNLQDHWPSAVLLWALAALAGWALLRDEAQQTLALLLIPAWLISEVAFATNGNIGDDIYSGRILFMWAVLYLTFFLDSPRQVVRSILFCVAVASSIGGIAMMLSGWHSFAADQTFIPFGVRFWCWVAIAAVPMVIAAFHGHKGLVPIAAATVVSIVLPWCQSSVIETSNGHSGAYTRTEPNLAAHALVAAFAIFFCWWGIRLASKAVANLGIASFGVTVIWFYFSSIYDALGRSLGLIGLGILFLAGGWALEKFRRRILATIARGATGSSIAGAAQ